MFTKKKFTVSKVKGSSERHKIGEKPKVFCFWNVQISYDVFGDFAQTYLKTDWLGVGIYTSRQKKQIGV